MASLSVGNMTASGRKDNLRLSNEAVFRESVSVRTWSEPRALRSLRRGEMVEGLRLKAKREEEG